LDEGGGVGYVVPGAGLNGGDGGYVVPGAGLDIVFVLVTSLILGILIIITIIG
jgi:hypothetical protein